MALDGGADGLDFYRAILRHWPAVLHPGSRLYFEVGIGQGLAAAHAMHAIARQPEAAGTIRSNMIIAMGLLESLTIYGLLIAFLLIGKLG